MKKTLVEIIKQTGFVLAYFLGDEAYQWLTGRDEFPKYYWIAAGLVLVYQIMEDLKELKKKI